MNVVFCDIDGTFQELGEDVPDINFKAVKALQDQGDQFVFISGRGYSQIKELVGSLPDECDVIFSNGAGHKFIGKEITYNHPLSLADCQAVLKVIEKSKVFYHLHTSHGVVLKPVENYREQFLALRKKLEPLGEAGKKIMDFKEQYFTNECQHIEDPLTYLKKHPEVKVVKIEIMDADDSNLAQLRESLASDCIYVFSSFIQCLEIVNPSSTKGEAVKEYMKKFTRAKSFGIGDGENDIDMLTAVDVPVAVANAKEIVKEKCLFMTEECKVGGVGKFILEQLIETK